MAKEHSSIFVGVVATVIGGLILATLLRLFGFFPVIWNWIVYVIDWAWHIVTYQVSLPVVMLFISFIFGYLLPIKLSANPAAGGENEVTELSQFEEHLVCVLASADGKLLGNAEIANKLNVSQLITEQAIEKLITNDMIFHRLSPYHGSKFRLSSKGRDYAITRGYVRGWS